MLNCPNEEKNIKIKMKWSFKLIKLQCKYQSTDDMKDLISLSSSCLVGILPAASSDLVSDFTSSECLPGPSPLAPSDTADADAIAFSADDVADICCSSAI